MINPPTRYRRFLTYLENRKSTSVFLLIAASVIALATLTNALDDLATFLGKYFPNHTEQPDVEQITQAGSVRHTRIDTYRNGDTLTREISDTAKSAVLALFWDDTFERLLTVPIGYQPGFILSADCILEKHMGGRVDLLSNYGRALVGDFYTIDNSYSKHFLLHKSLYDERAGNYTILASLETASGTTDTATLELDVHASTPGNSIPTVELSPINPVFSGARFSQQVYGKDSDGDKLIYFFLQAPRWLSINRDTGRITGTAPSLASGSQFVYTVRVSDGKDFTLKTFSFNVFPAHEQ